MAGILYVVSTPIGNLEDITLRALAVLREAGLIAAEDTRVTSKLLARHSISTPLTSYHEHNEREKAPVIISKLKEGGDVALTTDAGTPGISDPGYRLVRLAIENSIRVVPIPGPSAIVAALSVSGLPTDSFSFLGFVPHGEAKRREFLKRIRSLPPGTFVLYESPGRVRDTLASIIEVLGDIEAALAREMTKVHEEVLRGRASEVLRALPEVAKGEITLVIRTVEAVKDRSSMRAEIEKLIKEGLALKDIARAVSMDFNVSRGEAYREALKAKEELE